MGMVITIEKRLEYAEKRGAENFADWLTENGYMCHRVDKAGDEWFTDPGKALKMCQAKPEEDPPPKLMHGCVSEDEEEQRVRY